MNLYLFQIITKMYTFWKKAMQFFPAFSSGLCC